MRDFAAVAGAAAIDRAVADKALAALEVDAAGLDAMDRRYLTTIAVNYGGGPVGVETLAAALSEPRDAIEDIIEPYLIQCGFLQRTPRGRLITAHAFRHLGLPSRRAIRRSSGCSGPTRKPNPIDASHFKSRRVKGLAKIVTLATLPVASETMISTFISIDLFLA